MVYMAPLHNRAQADGVHGTTVQPGSGLWCNMTSLHNQAQADGVHGTTPQPGSEWLVSMAPLHNPGSSQTFDIKISSWLYFANHC